MTFSKTMIMGYDLKMFAGQEAENKKEASAEKITAELKKQLDVLIKKHDDDDAEKNIKAASS
jgi:hypothetical protein